MDPLPDLGDPRQGAFSDWTESDSKRQLVALGLLAGDWAQTRSIAKDPDNWHEINKILGQHPSAGKVNNYFATAMVGHTLLSGMLPPEQRKWLQYATSGLEAYMMYKNRRLGVGMSF